MPPNTFQRSIPNLPISRFLLFFFLFAILGLNGSVYPPASYLLFFSPLVFLVVLVLECHVRKVPFPLPDFSLLVLWLFILMFSIFSIPFSWSPAWSIQSSLRVGSFAIVSLLTASLFRRPKDLRLLTQTILLAVLVLLIQSYLSLIPNFPKPKAALSLVYAFHGHSHIADVLLLGLPIVFALMLYRQRIIWTFLSMVFLVSFFVSFSRMGLVIALFSLIATSYLLQMPRRRSLTVFFSLLIIAASLFLTIPTLFNAEDTHLQSLPWLHRQLFKGFSATRRLAYWEQGLQAFSRHPFMGTGPGTFRLVSESLQTAPGDYSWFAHNWYLQTLAEQGVIRFSLWFLLLFTLFRGAFRAVLARRQDPYVVGLFMGAAASALHSFFDFDWEFPGVFLVFLVVLSGLYNFSAQRRAQRLRLWGRFIPSFFLVISLFLLFAGIVGLAADLSWRAGEKLSLQGDISSAQASFLQSLRLNPLDDSRLQRYVRLYGPCCSPSFDAFLFHPKVPSLYEAYANWYVQQENFPEAAVAFEKALRLTLLDRPDLILALGDVYKRMGETEKQYHLYRDYVETFNSLSSRGKVTPLFPDALLSIFDAFIAQALSLGQYDAALSAFSSLVSLRPHGPRVYFLGGIIDHAYSLRDVGKEKEAYSLLKRYLDLVVPEEDPLLWRLDTAHRRIGEVAYLLSQHASDTVEEERFLKQAIRLDSWQVHYYLAYGDLLEKERRDNGAKTVYNRCLSFFPNDYQCQMRLNKLR